MAIYSASCLVVSQMDEMNVTLLLMLVYWESVDVLCFDRYDIWTVAGKT